MMQIGENRRRKMVSILPIAASMDEKKGN